jgi:hypothetical protein
MGTPEWRAAMRSEQPVMVHPVRVPGGPSDVGGLGVIRERSGGDRQHLGPPESIRRRYRAHPGRWMA